MFLDCLQRRRFSLRRGIWVVACLVAGYIPSEAQQQDPPANTCFVDLPVYDARGHRLTGLNPAHVSPEGNKSVDLLSIQDAKYRMRASGSRLYFPENLIGKRRIEITLRDSKGLEIIARVPLMSCQQRTSIEHGLSDSGADVSTTTVRGRLTGCKLDEEWWIRAMPMFGGTESPIVHEGFIRPADGEFWITSSLHGERHIVTIGKGKDPVRAFGVDIVQGSMNQAGNIDLRGVCP